MYYYLNGTLYMANSSCAVIDCGGVGYKLNISSNTFGKLAGKTGEIVRLFTYLSVREDALELFGFFSETEHSAFKQLIGVSGIGPKAAMAILSTLTPERLAQAIATGDTKAISAAPGVGAKTAARVILELKDKLAKEIGTSGNTPVLSGMGKGDGGNLSDAQNALMVLGYTRSEAAAALSKVEITDRSLEDIIRDALKQLMRQ